MKLSKQIMVTLGVVCVTSCAAMAGEPADIQAMYCKNHGR